MVSSRTVALFCIVPLFASAETSRPEQSLSLFSAVATEEAPYVAEATAGELGANAPAENAPPRAARDDGSRTVLAEVQDIEDRLSLDEAIRLALSNNLDIEVARTDPAIAEQAIRQAKGAFDPMASAEYVFNRNEEPTANSLQTGDSQGSDGWDYGASVSGILPFGLRYSTGTTVNRLETDQTIALLDRRFVSRWNSELTLPLMRDFLTNAPKVALRRSRMARDMSQEEFRSRLTTIVASVEDLYWDLAAKRAAVNVARKSLKTAEDLLEQTKVQEEVGVVSRVAVAQAEAGAAEREFNLIIAENAAAESRDALLDAILAPTAEVFADRDLIPDAPKFAEYPVDLNVAIKQALSNRPEVQMSQTVVEIAELETDLAENQAKPRLDLVAGYSTAGQAGRFAPGRVDDEGFLLNPRSADPLNPDRIGPAPDIPDSAVNSFDDFLRASGEHSYSLGFRVEVPIGNQTGRGLAAQRSIEARRARTDARRLKQQIVREVRRAVRTLESARKSVRASERRRAAAEESLRAEQERLRLGDSTPFQVLEFDADLSEAEGSFIDALRAYENSITELERVQGTLLETRNIEALEELER